MAARRLPEAPPRSTLAGWVWLACLACAAERESGDACAAMGGFEIGVTASCYMLGDNVFSGQDARSFCQAWGGDLVAIGSLEESAALARHVDDSVWIGANDQCAALRGVDAQRSPVECTGNIPRPALCEHP